MKIPYLDLSVNDVQLKKELLDAVNTVLTHGRIILGPEVEELEQKLAAYCNRRFAVGMNSCTDALYLTLRAFNIGEGDEVITTPLSWIATTNAIVLTGAKPVYVDIGNDLNINAKFIEEAITENTRAIIPVHFTGTICDMESINSLAEDNDLVVIEDAAQAFGSRMHGKPAGSFGNAACFSMNPMKVLNAYGEAGAVVVDDQNIYDKLCSLRYAGTINKEDCHYPSLNGRIDTIQASMLLVSLNHLEEKIQRRKEIAKFYSSQLSEVITCPTVDLSMDHSYYSYTILCINREKMKGYLNEKGIETKIQHPILMPHHTAYKNNYKSQIPNAERIVNQILCLPNHENLIDSELNYITDCIRNFGNA
tara:strand:- start:2501 stop:3592 length:1092 start_codon:yes stop_codon:yes gene_type:complete